jgi:hypothetical protein
MLYYPPSEDVWESSWLRATFLLILVRLDMRKGGLRVGPKYPRRNEEPIHQLTIVGDDINFHPAVCSSVQSEWMW